MRDGGLGAHAWVRAVVWGRFHESGLGSINLYIGAKIAQRGIASKRENYKALLTYIDCVIYLTPAVGVLGEGTELICIIWTIIY